MWKKQFCCSPSNWQIYCCCALKYKIGYRKTFNVAISYRKQKKKLSKAEINEKPRGIGWQEDRRNSVNSDNWGEGINNDDKFPMQFSFNVLLATKAL